MRFGVGGPALGLATAFLLAGCNSQETLPVGEAVSGKVTFNGAPLAAGRIVFIPEAGDSSPIPVMISQGEYSVPQEQGPMPGKYKVAIYEIDPKVAAAPVDEMPGESPRPPKQSIPPQYNEKTTLQAVIEPGVPNVKDFDAKK